MITSLCDISLEAEESLAISINSSILNESRMKKRKHWEFFFPSEIMYLRSEFPFCLNRKIRHAVKLKKKIKINLFLNILRIHSTIYFGLSLMISL